MITGVCIYGLKRPANAMVDLVRDLGSCLGRAQRSVTLTRIGAKSGKRLKLGVGQTSKGNDLPLDEYAIYLDENPDDEALLNNLGVYVGYVTSKDFGKLVAFSNKVSVAEFVVEQSHHHILAAARGSYGFIMGWDRPASFWAYASGFQDFASLNGDLLATTPAGRWGVQVMRSPVSVTVGSFRDVFEVNLVSAKHIEREIAPGCSVRQWLSRNPHFGDLEEIASDWFRWTVPREGIPQIKNQFLSSGLLDERFVSDF